MPHYAFPREANKSVDGNLIYTKKEPYDVGWLNEETNIFIQRGKEEIIGVPVGFEQDFNEAWVRFPDFTKIVPMPESLMVTSGSLGEMAHELLFGTKKPKFFPIDTTEQQKRFAAMDLERQKEAVDLAIKYQDNLVKYGHTTWYDWSCEHWGTKWNSSSCEKVSDNIYDFTTAWSGVPNLIEKISSDRTKIRLNTPKINNKDFVDYVSILQNEIEVSIPIGMTVKKYREKAICNICKCPLK